MIGTLLDVTRITSGRFTISRREVDLARVVEAVVARSQTALQRSGSRLTRSGDPHVTGAWDSSALEAAVGNLLSNALKFGEGRPIEITIAKAADRARLVVADQGIGIALDEQARIFERFERAVPMERYGGVGIGLWVVRHVVEAHGGTIRVESRPGAGSTFSVELPLDVPAGGVLESPSP